MIPEGWQEYNLDEVCEILDSLRIPVSEDIRNSRKGNVPYYGANGQKGWIDDFIFNEDLILLAEDGGHFEEYQTRPIAYRISGPSWVNNHAHVLRVKDGFNHDFVFYSLEHMNLLQHVTGSTRLKLTQGELRKIKLIIPTSQDLQNKIADVLNSSVRAIIAREKELIKLNMIKQGLQHDLLSGDFIFPEEFLQSEEVIE